MFHLIINNDHNHPYTIKTLAQGIQIATEFNRVTKVDVDVISCITGEILFSIGKNVYVAESVVYEI